MNDDPLVERALAVLKAQRAPEPHPLFVDRVTASALEGQPLSAHNSDWLLEIFGLAWRGAVLSAVAATVTVVGLSTSTPTNGSAANGSVAEGVALGSVGEVRSSLVTDEPWIGADNLYSTLLPVSSAGTSGQAPGSQSMGAP